MAPVIRLYYCDGCGVIAGHWSDTEVIRFECPNCGSGMVRPAEEPPPHASRRLGPVPVE